MKIRVNCDNCGTSFTKSARAVRKDRFNFCKKECYWEFRRKKSHMFTNKGLKYDYSQQKILKTLAREKKKHEFKPKAFWY